MEYLLMEGIGIVSLTGLIALTCWATFFCAIMPILFVIAAIDGPTGGRFWKDESDPRARAGRRLAA